MLVWKRKNRNVHAFYRNVSVSVHLKKILESENQIMQQFIFPIQNKIYGFSCDGEPKIVTVQKCTSIIVTIDDLLYL